MGWSGGTEVAQGIWDGIKEYIPEYKKKEVTNTIINILEDMDWDCVNEVNELYEISGRAEEDRNSDLYDWDLDG